MTWAERVLDTKAAHMWQTNFHHILHEVETTVNRLSCDV